MAQTNGNSVIGLQRLGAFAGSGLAWQVRFLSTPPQDRLDRVGTVIHCLPIVNNRFPVIQVYKLYGSGIVPPLENIPTYVGTEVWVNWFQSGLGWIYDRADP